MSAELEPLLRASLGAATPEWLDRLVEERVVARVRAESPRASQASDPVSAGARRSNGASGSWQRALLRLVAWLAARRDSARSASVEPARGWTAARGEATPAPAAWGMRLASAIAVDTPIIVPDDERHEEPAVTE